MRFALVPLAITLASASPVWKRQEVSSVLSSAVASATSAASSVVSEASSAVSSAVVSSAASSASAAPSASASAVPAYAIAYPCPAGSDLTYVEEQLSFPGELAAVTPLVGFQNSTWYGVQANETATSEIGSMRTVQFPGFPSTIMEVLVNMTMDPTTMAIQQEFNGTAPVEVMNLTVASYNTVFQLYQNDTVPTDVTAKIFSNICASPAAEVNAALTQLFTAALAALSTEAAAGPAPVPAPSAPSSGPSGSVAPSAPSAPAPPSVIASATSGAVSAISSAVAPAVPAVPSA